MRFQHLSGFATGIPGGANHAARSLHLGAPPISAVCGFLIAPGMIAESFSDPTCTMASLFEL